MKNLIYLMGIDGSGKTTLSHNFYNKIKAEGKSVKYLYARYRPVLTAPLKFLFNVLLYRKSTQFKNYEKYSEIKTNYSIKNKILARVYAIICIIDYIIFTWPLVVFKYFTAKHLIIDRYVGDLIVILSVASNLSDKEMLFFLRILHLLFPKPRRSFFIDIDEKTAFQRKDDIPSVRYLKERKSKYFVYKPIYHFEVLDGHLKKDELLNDLYNRVFDNELL